MNWNQHSEFDSNEIISYEEATLIKKEELKKVSWGPNHQVMVLKCTGVKKILKVIRDVYGLRNKENVVS